MSWDELLNHGGKPGGESFVRYSHNIYLHLLDVYLPPVRGIHPSPTLKAGVVQACDDQDWRVA
jgi:hypothetical protein